MNKVGWIIFSAAVVLLLGGLVVWTRTTNPPVDVSNVNANIILDATEASGNIGDHVLGKEDSKVILIEYGDFQCPSCGSAHPNVVSLMEEYGDRVAFVFRNFPLVSIHPNARAAAAAAEAAGLQDKYWDMHNWIFENQSSWSSLDSSQRTEAFISYAEQFGLNAETFTTDLASSNVNRKISFDQALGSKKGADATPAFYLNGEKLDEAAANGLVQGDLTEIKSQIDTLLSEQ